MRPIMQHTPTVIIIAGATATGKTALSVQLASQLSTEIISADSRQCFRELSVGVARPTDQELQKVPHHFIASQRITEPSNAGLFEQMALQKAADLFTSHSSIIMCGGTGLYIKSFVEGIDPMPEVPDSVRAAVEEAYQAKGLIWLQRELQHRDLAFWQQAEQQNPRRLQRALEVLNATGKSILQFRNATPAKRPFAVLPIVISLPTTQLRQRIDQRVDSMLQQGLLDEVKSVMEYRHLPALQTVGYRELIEHLLGKCSLDEAIQKIKTNTWQYARRQITWFKKQPGFIHLHSDEITLEKIQEVGATIF